MNTTDTKARRVAYLSWLASHHGAKADVTDAISAFTLSAVLLEAFYETTDTEGECVRLTVRGAKWLAEQDPLPDTERAPKVDAREDESANPSDSQSPTSPTAGGAPPA